MGGEACEVVREKAQEGRKAVMNDENDKKTAELLDADDKVVGTVDMPVEKPNFPKHIMIRDVLYEAQLDDYCTFAGYKAVPLTRISSAYVHWREVKGPA